MNTISTHHSWCTMWVFDVPLYFADNALGAYFVLAWCFLQYAINFPLWIYTVSELHRRRRAYIFIRLRCVCLVSHAITIRFWGNCGPLVLPGSLNILLGSTLEQINGTTQDCVHQLTSWVIPTAESILVRQPSGARNIEALTFPSCSKCLRC